MAKKFKCFIEFSKTIPSEWTPNEQHIEYRWTRMMCTPPFTVKVLIPPHPTFFETVFATPSDIPWVPHHVDKNRFF